MFPIVDEKIKQQDLAWAREYAKKQAWREAKTYQNTTPHQYIIVRKYDAGRNDFKRLFQMIEKYGQTEKFYNKNYIYLYLDDGYKYFAGDGGIWRENEVLLNRAKADKNYTI